MLNHNFFIVFQWSNPRFLSLALRPSMPELHAKLGMNLDGSLASCLDTAGQPANGAIGTTKNSEKILQHIVKSDQNRLQLTFHHFSIFLEGY